MSSIHLRPATTEDGKFIADGWLRSFQSAYHVKRVASDIYFPNHRAVISDLVNRGEVTVACDPTDPWTIWGWASHETRGSVTVVHYVYVKAAFRGLKVGSSLIRGILPPETEHLFWTHDTKASRSFLKGLREGGVLPEELPVSYNPYIMYR